MTDDQIAPENFKTEELWSYEEARQYFKKHNKIFVIIQCDIKHPDYKSKRHCIGRFVRKLKGVTLAPGIFVLPRFDGFTDRKIIIEKFVEEGKLDAGDWVICIEAANWSTYPDMPKRRRK